MKLPSADYRGSRAKVEGGGCEMREIWRVGGCKKNRRVEGGGSSVGTIEVVGGGGCEKIKFRRTEGSGSNSGIIKVVGGSDCEIEL